MLEAALAGCALVLGDIPSLREIWEGAALFVSPDSPADLEAALAALIREPRRRSALAARARLQAHSFTADRMAADYVVLYRELMSAWAQVPVVDRRRLPSKAGC